MLDGPDGVEVIADDILVCEVDETKEEARRDIDEKILNLIRGKRVKINQQKMKLHLIETKYMGHLTTKVPKLNDLPEPIDPTEDKQFLETVYYLAKLNSGPVIDG